MNQTQFDLHNKDCIEGMRGLSKGEVNICVTSPPYNLGIQYDKYDDHGSRKDYLKWTREWTEQVHRILSNDGSFFLNIGASPSNPMLPHQILLAINKLFVLQNTIHWIKSITVETKKKELISSGHFKPIRSHRYITDCHEYIFHLTKTGNTPIDRLAIGVPYTDKSNINRWSHTGGQDRRCRGNTWFIPYQTIHNRNEQRPHPATFPKELPEMCIRLHGWKQGIVMLDPFLGIGNSGLAARDCKISRFIGYEIDFGYYETAKEALEEKEVVPA